MEMETQFQYGFFSISVSLSYRCKLLELFFIIIILALITAVEQYLVSVLKFGFNWLRYFYLIFLCNFSFNLFELHTREQTVV